ncbi:MAG: SIS domain-containing protein [Acidobacteriota bacterium]
MLDDPISLGRFVEDHLRASAAVKLATLEQERETIVSAARLLAETFREGGKLLLCGNGGSAADCQHLAAELVSLLAKEYPRPGLPAIALTTDSSFLTAYANDFGFEGVFARQVEALGRPGDLLVGITTSGGSVNVVRALETAAARGLRTIALTGEAGLRGATADLVIRVPHSSTMYIQETHLAIEHLLCGMVERLLFPRL